MDGLCVFQGIFLRKEYILSTIPKEGSQSVKFRVYLSYRKGIPSSSFYSLERVKSWWKAHMGVPISLFCPQVTISSSLFFLLSLSPSSGEYLKLLNQYWAPCAGHGVQSRQYKVILTGPMFPRSLVSDARKEDTNNLMCLRQNAGRASQVAGEMSVSNHQSQPTSKTKSREKTLKEPDDWGLE